MKSRQELTNLIEQSLVTLIGYSFEDEKIKDDLISNFNYVEINEIDSSFSLKSFLRTQRLNQILEDSKKFDYLLFDLNNIKPPSDSVSKWDRVGFIRNVIEKLSKRVKSSVLAENLEHKIIITSPVNKTLEKDEIGSFVGGNQPIYMADLVVVIKVDKAKVIKNINGYDSDYILYNIKQSVEI